MHPERKVFWSLGSGQVFRMLFLAFAIASFSVFTAPASAFASTASVSCSGFPVNVSWTLSGTVATGQVVTINDLTIISTAPIDISASKTTLTVTGGSPSTVVLDGGAAAANTPVNTNYGNKSFTVTGNAGSNFTVSISGLQSLINGTWAGCPGLGGNVLTPTFISASISSAATTTTQSSTATTKAGSSNADSSSGSKSSGGKTTATGETTTTVEGAPTTELTTDSNGASGAANPSNHENNAKDAEGSTKSKKGEIPVVLPAGGVVVIATGGAAYFGFFRGRRVLRKLASKLLRHETSA